ncbi:LLM class flavin-dependent oxidoreductase [Paenibacillus sp. JCM 10914]|uniref:LLM class flavin-dependent oxidoreductase n=1 Tax=Paenibacillus sp. JCM 10914 TaxID=1236974 RepID=UPI0003CCB66A|nr:LLM class flavin-dependent oxidoreductase [Paenibacillus sp. JCM 10914]GAE08065.1 coenzyme F420-dependent N5,N10-methylene tetrahydromethanopterin reductase and related flavin-dependent oxidoreductases [Paenibacillus sp. JCM 10914]
MKKQIHLNAFEMNCPGHLAHGLWAHPEDERTRYKDLTYWLELAQLLEKGKFDALFLADVLGVYDVYGNGNDPAIRRGVQIPANDPMMIIPAMATVTQHLGFALTASTTYEQPFAFARRMSTLDHLTKGRIAWNVVTSTLRSAANNHGLDKPVGHDDRYEVADEFLKVCYKLWEQSWEDDAVVKDWDNHLYTDPDKVHFIDHKGKYFSVAGPHLSEPSPQRTPLLYQAGTSAKGSEFAAKHAECVFIGGHRPDVIRRDVEEIRRKAVAFGRQPEQVKTYGLLTVVTGRTKEEAERKFADYSSYFSEEGALLHYSANTGYDLSAYSDDEYLEYVPTDHGQSLAALFTKDAVKPQTVGEIKKALSSIGSRGLLIVGDPEEVADRMEQWMVETGLDGFNLTQVVTPGTLQDFIELVIPILQQRGIYRREYGTESTLRQRLFGGQDGKLPAEHRAIHISRRELGHDAIPQSK